MNKQINLLAVLGSVVAIVEVSTLSILQTSCGSKTTVPYSALDIDGTTLRGIKDGAKISKSVTTLTVPKNITQLGAQDGHGGNNDALFNLENYSTITKIDFEEGSKCSHICWCLSGNMHMQYISEFDMKNITVPFTLGGDGRGGFHDDNFRNTKITHLVLPGNMTSIGHSNFYNNSPVPCELEYFELAEGSTPLAFLMAPILWPTGGDDGINFLKTIVINRQITELGILIGNHPSLSDIWLNIPSPTTIAHNWIYSNYEYVYNINFHIKSEYYTDWMTNVFSNDEFVCNIGNGAFDPTKIISY